MPSKQLQKLFDMAERAVRKDFEFNGGVPTIVMVEMPNGKIEVSPPMRWANNAEKKLMMDLLKLTLQATKAERYVIFMEMWLAFVIVPPGVSQAEVEAQTPAPSEHPDRKEGVMIYGEERGSIETLSGYIEIIRPKIGKPRLGQTIHTFDGARSALFGNLLGDSMLN